ncbi:MAG: hypothetical protein LUD39_03640, partial [Opitutae bacterium]|nr:hypothetical protein [Opitutae bacterium]
MQLRHAKKVLNFRATVATSRGEFCSRESIVVELVGDGGDCGRGEIAPWQGFGCEKISAAEEILTTMEAEAGATRHQLENFLRDRESVAKFPCTAHALSAAKFFVENPKCFLAPEPPRAETAQLIFREPATMPEDVATEILRQSREPPPTRSSPPPRRSPPTPRPRPSRRAPP